MKNHGLPSPCLFTEFSKEMSHSVQAKRKEISESATHLHMKGAKEETGN
jgi:hypothetical protein